MELILIAEMLTPSLRSVPVTGGIVGTGKALRLAAGGERTVYIKQCAMWAMAKTFGKMTLILRDEQVHPHTFVSMRQESGDDRY